MLNRDKIAFIQQTLDLAKKGMGYTAPNPMVGALIYKEGKVLATGYHQKYGGPHAEVEALQKIGGEAEGSTLFCNLEPCCHTKKQTPPCVDLIIQRKIKKVIVATLDPNPAVSGKGMQALSDAGIEVEHGFLESEAQQLNEVFFKYIQTGRPFVHLKLAQTLDGKICTLSGDSQWITGEVARAEVHKLRGQYSAVLVGMNTMRRDNPHLTIRHNLQEIYPQPYRIILGTNLEQSDLKSHVFTDEWREKTIFMTLKSKEKLLEELQKRNITVIELDMDKEDQEKLINLKDVLFQLGERKISSVLVEGGAKIATAFLKQKLVDKVTFWMAPKILGEGVSAFDFFGPKTMRESLNFYNKEMKVVDDHFCFTAYPQY